MRKHIILKLWLALICMAFFAHDANSQSFYNEIPIPDSIMGNDYRIRVGTSSHNFSPGQPGPFSNGDTIYNRSIPTYSYTAAGQSVVPYLGPTMIWERTQPIQIEMINTLPGNNTTSHWHGVNLPDSADGGPHEVIAPGTSWNVSFSLIDSVQTCWYHSHLMDSTTEQVIMGLAGMILIQDTVNDPFYSQLPNEYNVNDFPVIIQEKAFTFSDSISGTDTFKVVSGMVASDHPGNGTVTLVNGVMNGFLHVPSEMTRLRFLNGSPRKSFHLAISDALANPDSSNFETLWQIATDGGYTESPYPTDSFIISPGERMEFVVDFSAYSNGDTVYLNNRIVSMPADIVAGGGGPPNPVLNTPGNAFMAFVIDDTITTVNPISSLPVAMLPYDVNLSGIFQSRFDTLMGQAGGGGSNNWTINGDTMDMNVLNRFVLVNKKEKWTIKNNSNVAHPFHIHKVQFQVYEYIDSVGGVDTMTYPNLPNYMLGYKDVILVRAGAKVTFVAKFDSFPAHEIDPMHGFMYHCHILTHEDHSMMHQFTVLDSMTFYNLLKAQEISQASPFTLFPNPASDKLFMKGISPLPGMIRFADQQGRILREEELAPFDGTVSFEVEDLPRGLYIVEYTTGNLQFTKKIILK